MTQPLNIKLSIVGNGYRSFSEKLAYRALRPGDKLRVLPEPENKFDLNALKVCTDDLEYHLGYIPAADARKLALAVLECGQLSSEWPGFPAVVHETYDPPVPTVIILTTPAEALSDACVESLSAHYSLELVDEDSPRLL